jgi:predicted MFS family arabinose efflux permease
LPHYARSMGSTPADGMHYLFIFGLGVVCGPLPFGWLADRKSVPFAAIVAGVLGSIGALAMLGGHALPEWSLWLIGAASGGLFTLAFVDVALFHSRARIGVFMSTVGALYTLFATLGPWMSGALMDLFGVQSLPALVFALLFFSASTAVRAAQKKHRDIRATGLA